MNYYADVILPLPLHGTFTYELTKKQHDLLGIGHRVAVSFGKRKVYTGVIKKIHNIKPKLYETKPIEFIYDKDELIIDKEYFIKKLDISHSQYEEVMNSKPKLHSEYKSYKKLYNFLRQYSKAFSFVKNSLNKI